MSQDPNFSWIKENWHKVQAVFIVPQFLKGAFIGLSLEGGVIKTRESWNTGYYNQAVQPYGILAEQSVANPQADPL